jgi:ribosomal protein L30
MSESTITIKQIRSAIRRHHRQRATLVGLGLNRIGRVVTLGDTPQTRGMIRKVKHLIQIIPPPANGLKSLSRLRFSALAGYAREPATVLIFDEREWHATNDERVLGVVVRDRNDEDYGWVILGKDERLRYRAITAGSEFVSPEAARHDLFNRMKEEHAKADEEFYQKDTLGPPTNFFTPVVAPDRLSPTFKILTTERRYSPAHGLIEAMMRFYEDTDGNFVEQFQSTAFDARLWELLLFATFSELGFAPQPGVAMPDFIFVSPFGSLGIEATTVNPGAADVKQPDNQKELSDYIENYIPIRLARSLKAKLERKNPYWEKPEMKGKPFVIAVQDFHSPGAMRMIVSAMTEYAFGVRHTLEGSKRKIEWIKEHVWKHLREESGFFKFEKAVNVSAIIINPQGTLPKFNRLGYLVS